MNRDELVRELENFHDWRYLSTVELLQVVLAIEKMRDKKAQGIAASVSASQLLMR